ncbi:predicted transport protein [Bacteroidales bacterium 6E]|jgi:predicted transport protein|nr:predicted transport protein [Bacteroidales bacterium 6E]
MDNADKTMIQNLEKNTGKSLNDWINLVNGSHLQKHGEIRKMLIDQHGLTYGYANLVAHKALATDAGSVGDKNELIEKQYKGKEHFIPVYERLMEEILKWGDDVEIAPKNAYVSLRRKRQFAMLQPATKSRFEVGLNLKGTTPEGKLAATSASNMMCSHFIALSSQADIDSEVFGWIRKAYDQSV